MVLSLRKLSLVCISLILPLSAHAEGEIAVVVARFGSCDYFVADGPRGLYVLEWFGGYDPQEGDRLFGDISSYGMKDVIYLPSEREGRLWVEDYLESERDALEEINDHC